MIKKLSQNLSFAVIGAGSGGQAFAGYLSSLGYSVNLYNRSIEPIRNIKNNGYMDLVGNINCRGMLNIITNNIEKAIKDVDVIMVVLPANAHKHIACKIAPFVSSNQYIVLNPGRTGGALEFHNILRKYNPFKKYSIVEAQTLLFACRAVEPGVVKIFSKKEEVKIAALPASHTMGFINLIDKIIPEFSPMSNVLETSFNNIGAVLHPIPTILNCGRIENTMGDFQYYIEGITPSVEKIINKVDAERMQIAKALGINGISLMDWLSDSYNSHGSTLCEALSNTKGYWGIMAPSSMNTRYIFEDIPQSLVPIYDMAQHLGINTPTIQSMIHLASTIHEIDYLKYGRRIVDMGLCGLPTVEAITHFVETGEMQHEAERLVVL